MTRQENQAAMFAINAARAMETNPISRKNLAIAYRTHQIVEAMLTGNLDSIETVASHG